MMAAEACATGAGSSNPNQRLANPLLAFWCKSSLPESSCSKLTRILDLALLIFPTDKNKPVQSNFELN
jgi:hypothetical protein